MAGFDGAFIWYEMRTMDVAATAAFYARALDMPSEDFDKPATQYRIFKAGGTDFAGVMALRPDMLAAGAKPGWVGYIGVDDVDARATQVVQSGGFILHPPDDIPTVGRFAVATDPQHAAFVLFTPLPRETPAPLADRVGWHELITSDREAAFTFYAALFGWTKGEAFNMGPTGTYQLFAHGGKDIGGMMNQPPDMCSPAWSYYIRQSDVAVSAARITAAGGTVLMGPTQVPGGDWIVQATDPAGTFFAIVSPPRAQE